VHRHRYIHLSLGKSLECLLNGLDGVADGQVASDGLIVEKSGRGERTGGESTGRLKSDKIFKGRSRNVSNN
jgi:hypothetical protein